MTVCRWCGVALEPMGGAWVDAGGMFNCGKHRRHWPVGASDLACVSLHQPYATLMALLVKRFETRGWQTHHRGRFGIAAAKTPPKVGLVVGAYTVTHGHDGYRLVLTEKRGDYSDGSPYVPIPLGALVATGELIDCAPCGGPTSFRTGSVQGDEGDFPDRHVIVYHPAMGSFDESLTIDAPGGRVSDITDQLPYGDFSAGRYGWVIDSLVPTEGRCPRCWGTGWICDVHGIGACAACDAHDCSLSGCPVCTPPGGCGGTGSSPAVPVVGKQGVWRWSP